MRAYIIEGPVKTAIVTTLSNGVRVCNFSSPHPLGAGRK